jgi:hypothetical protein
VTPRVGPAGALLAACAVLAGGATAALRAAASKPAYPQFHTSDRCIACHNELLTASGEDVSIGFDWRASMMANSSRDPYWQASVRRETIDHPQAASDIQDECSVCHMPILHYEAKSRGERARVFDHLPFRRDAAGGHAALARRSASPADRADAGLARRSASPADRAKAADGVSCSVCHQISTEKLGTPDSYNGGFVVQAPADPNARPEYGPFEVDQGHRRIMLSSTEGYQPTQSDHIGRSEMCATCHTLFTQALGPDGRVVGRLPEQVPYQEWLHSDYRGSHSCQSCHMPRVNEPAPITRVFGQPREGISRHVFVAANFFVQRMLNRYRDTLEVEAQPQELTAAADRTVTYLGSRAAGVRIGDLQVEDGRLRADVIVENLGGHKLPTAFPSRRAWLHLVVRDAGGRVVFESGALNADGSVQGNDNDSDPLKLEPHYAEIRSADQVQIYESILGDPDGHVTTGLLTAVRYLKDNRLLPRGFDKQTAEPDIAVRGSAAADPDFAGGQDHVRYSVPIAAGGGPFTVTTELLYQPIGYRWANNLKPYNAPEPQRFTTYYDSMAAGSAAMLARAAGSTAK